MTMLPLDFLNITEIPSEMSMQIILAHDIKGEIKLKFGVAVNVKSLYRLLFSMCIC